MKSSNLLNARFFFGISLLMIYNFGLGQTANNTNKLNSKNIYYQAIANLYKSEHFDQNSKPDTVYVVQVPQITDSLLNKYSVVRFVVLDHKTIAIKATKDSNLTWLEVLPLEFQNGFFYVPIKRWWVSNNNEKGEAQYKMLDCMKMEFNFSKGMFFLKRKLICLTTSSTN